ncbi:MAG: FAD-linked oxidase C-terminal domain-containing protein, partial [Bacteroidota bacterium]
SDFLVQLSKIFPKDRFTLLEEERLEYASDHTEDLVYLPHVVVFPEESSEVASLMKLCSRFLVPVTTSGALTGLSGGALPVKGGVALSTKRMNKILDLDIKNGQITVQPGVIVEEMQKAVEEHGLYYAPDPASRGTCTIGGNLAENSGGPRAVKYGVTKDWVLDMEVVLSSGEIIQTGAKTLKNSTGYSLTQLMVGSEGTLGVITKSTHKLIAKPKLNHLMLFPFRKLEEAGEAVSKIFNFGVNPSAVELMEKDAILLSQNFTGDYSLGLDHDVQALLLVEVDGNIVEELQRSTELMMEAIEGYDIGEILFADDAAQKDKLWFLRRRVGEAVKAESTYKEEDTVVPRFELPKLLAKVKSLGKEFGFRSICYGHAGDGNLHINILKDDLSNEQWNEMLPEAITQLFREVVKLGGTISGEHGIGWVQKDFMPIRFSTNELSLMKGIKDVFDPNGILNPKKVLP